MLKNGLDYFHYDIPFTFKGATKKVIRHQFCLDGWHNHAVLSVTIEKLGPLNPTKPAGIISDLQYGTRVTPQRSQFGLKKGKIKKYQSKNINLLMRSMSECRRCE